MLRALMLVFLAGLASARSIGARPGQMWIHNDKRQELQDIVTFDNSSLFVRGERVLFFSGEVHPYRLPVPGLWLDLFQKIKALGFNGVSFYTSWASLEGKQGEFIAEGIFNFDDFFKAASDAGIYLLARPGPYINAEATGGGFPGWLQRNPGILRTPDPDYLSATDNYVANMAGIIAKAQITNGGPVILYQPENEYSQADSNVVFPDSDYFQYVIDQARNAGIVVPLISNDNAPKGLFSPDGQQAAKVDIYGHDNYPLGFDCAQPDVWPNGNLPTNYRRLHLQQAPSTPYSLVEYQGGAFDPWGGNGFDKCLSLVNYEFERVFYKNMYAAAVTIFNIYMTYGGTNWGNQGHPGGYTSYDYGASIAEDLTVSREKYSEIKLQANFLHASPKYLVATPQNNEQNVGAFTNNAAIAVIQSITDTTNFYVVRHSQYNSIDTQEYQLTVPTSQGNVTVPQLGGNLVLTRRDSKFHVTDYDVGGTNLLYSSAEIFTWKKYEDKTVLVVYGGPNELHEFAVQSNSTVETLEGEDLKIENRNGNSIVQFEVSPSRRVLRYGDLYVYILDRNSAYNFWTVDLPTGLSSGDPNAGIKAAAIVKAGYLVRTAAVDGTTLSLVGDVNATTSIEVVGGAPRGLETFNFNGKALDFKQDADTGVVTATVEFVDPQIDVPDLSTAEWKTIDSLPEIQDNYDDSLWTEASLTESNNTARNLTTPTSLYSSDYGYHTGPLVYRGRFTAGGNESSLYLSTQGGSAFGVSVWLGSQFLSSFAGNDKSQNANQTITLPSLTAGQEYIIVVVVDVTGINQNYNPGSEDMKQPRGILDYNLSGRDKSAVTWKLTGNLGGESYRDRARGPLNEGGLFFERNGYHLPSAPIDSWTAGSPLNGTTRAGVQFYGTQFDLDIPSGYTVPLAISFGNSTADTGAGGLSRAYRAQIYVNGYQYGKYVHNVGPQDVYPVPQGIWNYKGPNYLGVSLWVLEADGAALSDFKIVVGEKVQTGYGEFPNSPQDGYVEREGAY
ncbi:putative beta-galactosidase A [Elsinoe australis]|uniref:Beta-galactosidase n=1 Tax=Elsinoe australis TaxID=40998 RepID=A0A4U7AXT2_9PEZI|nr:putative beta-galactosidase A [Elsinoe australis]